jgi:DNA-binding Xre family transcriptional regulator
MRILTLAHKGESSREIVTQVGRSQTTVLRITRTYNYETFRSRTLTRLCKQTTTIREDRILL